MDLAAKDWLEGVSIIAKSQTESVQVHTLGEGCRILVKMFKKGTQTHPGRVAQQATLLHVDNSDRTEVITTDNIRTKYANIPLRSEI